MGAFLGGGSPAAFAYPPAPVQQPAPQRFTDIPQMELNRFELSRIGPDQFVDSRGNSRSGAEVKALIAGQPAEKPILNLDSGAEQQLDTLADLDTQAAKAATGKEEELKKKRGRKATIKTGPLGIVDPAPIRVATLLGG